MERISCVIELEKDTYVFIPEPKMNYLLMFYLKEDNKNIELAKKVWMNELNYGDFIGKTDFSSNVRNMVWKFDSFDIKDKNKYITKSFTSHSYTQIVAQMKFVMKEIM